MRLLVSALTLAAGVLIVPLSADDAGKTYGDGVALKRAVPIATLLATPQAHAGKAVRVDGVVSQVCQAMGCWIEIAEIDGICERAPSRLCCRRRGRPHRRRCGTS